MTGVVLVTGAGGLVGSETVDYFSGRGFAVVGIENDMRARFFGESASTNHVAERLRREHAGFSLVDLDIRDGEAVAEVFRRYEGELALVVHAAAQPSHDWAASDPHTDFGINAVGTLNLLEAARAHALDVPFVFMSTNKVYGDTPNYLPLEEHDLRLELPGEHPWHGGIDTTMSIDRTMHSLFGVSKAAADLLVQEYGRYFGLPTVAFRAGCITGPGHAGAKLHGFLSYLMRCAITGTPYTVYGYGGKQVRDNIHSYDLVRAFDAFRQDPCPGRVYNIGGGRESNCSVLEAIEISSQIVGHEMDYSISDDARRGDHRWWVSDLGEFQADYPEWVITRNVEETLGEIHERNADRWQSEAQVS